MNLLLEFGLFAEAGSNALDISKNVRKRMEELSRIFPDDLEYTIVYDPTDFVKDSINAVIKTLFDALILVVLVVILFLQNWRVSVIPLLAVPVSIVGTFAFMLALGFTINVLTLFGLILAIGIVVDDAIVVVENVERNIESGLKPREATIKAMKEVTGPVIATSLVIAGVFIPISFMSGLIGMFYKQFALTIVIATFISTFNSLTLSPALSARLLQSRGTKPDILTRGINGAFGWLFKGFNAGFMRTEKLYSFSVGQFVRRRFIMMCLFAVLIGLTATSFKLLPPGFIPPQGQKIPNQLRATPARRHAGANRRGHPHHVRSRDERGRRSGLRCLSGLIHRGL